MSAVSRTCGIIFLCLFLLQVCAVARRNNSRQKRLLHFPEKTNVVMTMSLLKLLPSESIINTLTEYDVLFPVPLHPYKIHSRFKREIERNVIYEQLKIVMNMLSIRGELGAETFIYEMKKSLEDNVNGKENVLKDIVNILFK